MWIMIEIKGKTIIYTLPSNDVLGQVSPFLFIEKLEDEIALIWPQIKVNKVFANRKQGTHQIYCVLPFTFTNEQIRLIKLQIELIASSLLTDLKDKIYFAGLAS
jgi:hypothetical protein